MASQSNNQSLNLPPLETSYDPLRDDLQNFRNSIDGTGASPTSTTMTRPFPTPLSSPPTPTGTTPRKANLPFLRTRNRTASGASMTFLQPAPIALVDNTIEPSDRSAGAYVRSVVVGDYTIINESPLRAGAYVVWTCTVETLEGTKFNVIKRYSEFNNRRQGLNYFLTCILMNPEFAGSPMVKEFLFNKDE
ncbi:hypothetical protein ABW21_db0201048 [Orbilia brochopaga]|nr:hypothetical protein ABW21_db0201048 [Drechslerella brochopaga]